MRTAVACFVLAAAIATPGIVLAATSSDGHGAVLVPDVVTGTATAAGQFHPSGPQRVDSRLRPAVDAVRRALERRGGEPVHVLPAVYGIAQLVQLPTSGHQCPTTVTFELGKPQSGIVMQEVGNGPPCGSGSTDHRGVHVTYSPKSVGFVIREALATLPG